MLLDRDAITNGPAGAGGPFEFYDLGHGYCSYSFFEQCPHRMACARCDFYLPKQSSQAQLLEAKDGLQRMLVQIPLTDDERAAVEGDHDAVDRLLDRLADTPTPAGPTPRDLDQPAARVDAMSCTSGNAALTAAGTEDAHGFPAPCSESGGSPSPSFADRRPDGFKVATSPFPSPAGSVPRRPPAGISGYVNHRIPTRREPKMSASAPAVNSVTLVGNLTADPVLKQLDDDRKVCQLRLAVNDQKDQPPMFIDVATFGAQADACAKYLAKGRAVAVTGRLVYREWDDNGTRRSRHHIVGRVQFGGRPDNGDQPTDTNRPARTTSPSDPPNSTGGGPPPVLDHPSFPWPIAANPEPHSPTPDAAPARSIELGALEPEPIQLRLPTLGMLTRLRMERSGLRMCLRRPDMRLKRAQGHARRATSAAS